MEYTLTVPNVGSASRGERTSAPSPLVVQKELPELAVERVGEFGAERGEPPSANVRNHVPLSSLVISQKMSPHIQTPTIPPPVGGEALQEEKGVEGGPELRWGELRTAIIRTCLLGREESVQTPGGTIGVGLLINQAKAMLAKGVTMEELLGVLSVMRATSRKLGREILGPCSLAVLVTPARDENTGERTGVEDWSFWQDCLHEWSTRQPSRSSLEVTRLVERLSFLLTLKHAEDEA